MADRPRTPSSSAIAVVVVEAALIRESELGFDREIDQRGDFLLDKIDPHRELKCG